MSRVDDLYLHEDEDVDDGDDTSPLLINSGTDAAANNNSSSSTASPLPARPTTPRSQQQQQYQERMMADRTPLLLDKETIRAQVQAQLAATSRRGSGNNVAVAVVDNGSSTQGNINSRGSQDGEEGEDDYVTADDDPIGDALQRCFHEVIRPFGMFLCVIGWRPFVGAPTVVSNLYVVSIGLLLMCNYVYNVLYAVYGDRGSLLSEYIVQAVLSFGVWAYGTYHFHREEGKAFQEIAALIETVFLRCSDAQTGKLTQTALTNTLRSYLGEKKTITCCCCCLLIQSRSVRLLRTYLLPHDRAVDRLFQRHRPVQQVPAAHMGVCDHGHVCVPGLRGRVRRVHLHRPRLLSVRPPRHPIHGLAP